MRALKLLIVHAARERLSGVNRPALAAATLLIPLLPLLQRSTAGRVSLPGEWTGILFALIFGSGLIGPDVASGVIQLMVARPVTRAQIVLARWLAAAGLAVGCVLTQVLTITMVRWLVGAPPDAAEVWAALLPGVTVGLGLPAVLICLSALIVGMGDVRAWVLLLVGGEILKWAGTVRDSPGLARAGSELAGLMLPVVEAAGFSAWPPAAWLPVVAWASTVSLALAGAVHLFNRRELSYGAA